MTAVAMTYQRIGDTYTYHLAYMLEDVLVEWRGDGVTFRSIIWALSDALNVVPDGAVVFRRTDRPGLDEIKLDAKLRDLIRQDPDKYLEIVTEPDRVVVVGDRKAERSSDAVRLHVRTGYDTLAESFGDSVFIRLRDDGNVECLMCGRWTATLYEQEDVAGTDSMTMLQCPCSLTTDVPVRVAGSWVELSTYMLASVKFLPKYYIPRAWNPKGWISHLDLVKLYVKYKEEIADV
jgi:hypothetical protein